MTEAFLLVVAMLVFSAAPRGHRRLPGALLLTGCAFVLLLVFAGPASARGSVDVIPNVTLWSFSALNKLGPYSMTQLAAFEAQQGYIRSQYADTSGFCATRHEIQFDSGAFRWTVHRTFEANGSPTACGANPAPEVRAGQFFSAQRNVCPDHASGLPTDAPTACTCNSGFKPDSTAKACIPDCTAKEEASSGYYDIGPNQGASPKLLACAGNCEVVFDGVSPAGSAMVAGQKHWFARGAYYMTGSACTPVKQEANQVGESTPNKPEDSCAPGQAKGEVNGKAVCVDQSGEDPTKPTKESEQTSTTKTEKTTTTNPDGSTTTTETTTKVGADGSKEVTITRTTTQPDGSVSTETETTGNKPPASDEDGEEGEESECRKNPSAAGCGGEGAPITELYVPKDKALSSVLGAGRDAFLSSPIGSAAGSFFVVSGTSTCPTWSASIPYIEAELRIDQFCAPFATTALAIFKAVLLVVASFFAFRIAVE